VFGFNRECAFARVSVQQRGECRGERGAECHVFGGAQFPQSRYDIFGYFKWVSCHAGSVFGL
jgi:hypothetical protein